ncbi:tRNA uridine-5-carboxymethylaminomethyl(34) synthesis GTPase MnmE [bacterium]|nr:MAG: tRNA uridine-5-carboxymethylaminomethyl(34) synthesis GTPase MnmE [bacterium]
MTSTDTITAISTPVGEGGIGIIRISGPTALNAAFSIFSPVEKFVFPEPRQFYIGHFKNLSSKIIDKGFLVFFKGPASYTGEDIVELHCHGSMLVLKKILYEVIKSGARLAMPGEFTKRAFLNGKMDLVQAEAVIDVIRAGTENALSAASARLEGRLSKKIDSIKEVLADTLARMELEFDFSEDDTEADKTDFTEPLEIASAGLKKLLLTYEEGVVLKDGLRTLILGRPNAGKSSLLNVLLQQERAIVTDIPGTTRDFIEEAANIRGILIRLIDTAGLRETNDQIESMGVDFAVRKINAAGLVIYVFDATSQISIEEDKKLLEMVHGKKLLVAVNKNDLVSDSERAAIKKAFNGHKLVFISALNETGIDNLKNAIFEQAVGRTFSSSEIADTGGGAADELLSSLRHKEAAQSALKSLENALTALLQKTPLEFIAIDLRRALNSLGEITGEVTTEEILDRIFSSFCVGK